MEDFALEQPSINPLLNRLKIPGETHRLPSRGLFYNDGELSPDVKDGEIHIYPMTAYDEILIRSVDKLFSGDALVEIFSHCVPQVLKPLRLLAKDVDFIIVCLRKISYGSTFEINYTHTCENAKNWVYGVPMDSFIRNAKSLDPTLVSHQYSVKMPNGQIVRVHPLRYDAIIKIMQSTDTDYSEKKQHEVLMDSLLDVIEIVDEIRERQFIYEWLTKLSPEWLKEISKAIDSTSDWGTDFNTTIVCKDCGQEVTIPAPMNPLTFFF